MPATPLIVWTKTGGLAADLAAVYAKLPVRATDVRSGAACFEALAGALFPVAAIEADAFDDDGPECLVALQAANGLACMIGKPDADLFDRAAEFGVLAWMPRRSSVEQWSIWLTRAVAESQRRFQTAGGR